VRYWTAGQRIDPKDDDSEFVWKVTLSNGTVIQKPQDYNYWGTGQPSNYGGLQSCLELKDSPAYKWNDQECSSNRCSLCEIDP